MWWLRFVVVGNVSLGTLSLNPGLLILKELQLFGSSSASRDELSAVLDMAAAGKLKPVVHKVMKLEEVEQAHLLLQDKNVCGRIVLVPPKPEAGVLDKALHSHGCSKL